MLEVRDAGDIRGRGGTEESDQTDQEDAGDLWEAGTLIHTNAVSISMDRPDLGDIKSKPGLSYINNQNYLQYLQLSL